MSTIDELDVVNLKTKSDIFKTKYLESVESKIDNLILNELDTKYLSINRGTTKNIDAKSCRFGNKIVEIENIEDTITINSSSGIIKLPSIEDTDDHTITIYNSKVRKDSSILITPNNNKCSKFNTLDIDDGEFKIFFNVNDDSSLNIHFLVC